MSSRGAHSGRGPETQAPKIERVCLLVLGMHRSGTSALTRVLSLLGADLPATLLSGTDANRVSNAKGHWESEPIVRLNDDIFNSAGISWRSPETMPQQWYESAFFNQFRKRARAILESEYDNSPLFVLKDPRTCKLVPFWLSVLEQAGIKPAIVHMVRSYEEVADSLLKRNALDRPLGILMWLRYVLVAERDSRAHQRVHLSFDGLLADWQRSAQSVADTFAIRWPSASTERAEQVNEYLSDPERHHRRAQNANSRDDIISWATQVHAIIDRWVENGESAADYPALDDVADRVARAVQPLLAPLLVSYEKSASVHKLQAIRADQKAKIERTEGKIAKFEKQLADLAELVAMPLLVTDSAPGAGDVPLSTKYLSGLAGAFKEQRVRQDKVADELVAKNADLTSKMNELSDLRARFESDIAELNLRDTRSQDLILQEKEQRETVEKRIEQLQRVNATLLIIRGRYEAASEQLARLDGKYEDARKRLNQAERALVEQNSAATERDRNLKTKLELARALAKSHETTIIGLREDRVSKILQRDRSQATVAAIRDEKAAQIQQRDARIKDLRRAVKRLEKKVEERERERGALSRAATLQTAASQVRPPKSKLLSFIPGGNRRRLRDDIDLVRNSGLFDAEYYRARYQDLQDFPDDLLEHYVRHGGAEGRAPSAAFDGRQYLQQYPDIAHAGINPLVHFLKSGWQEGRTALTVGSPKEVIQTDGDEAPEETGEPHVAQTTNSDKAAPIKSEIAEMEAPAILEAADGAIEQPSAATAEPLDAGSAPLQVATFASFANNASDWVRSSQMAEYDALKAGDIAVALDNGFADPRATAALTWLNALTKRPADAAIAANLAVRRTLLEGGLNVDDVWLSSDYTLQFRLRVEGDYALIARCCQLTEEGEVVLCAEGPLVARQSNIFHARLVNRFASVLLVLTDRQGNLVDSTLLPFPTLVRGGLHHGELIDHDVSLTGWAAHEAHASELLAALADTSRAYAVADISVVLAKANGTEPIFSKSFRQWLSRQFQVGVGAAGEADSDNPALRVLAEQLRPIKQPQAAPHRPTGRTLVIGSNAIPSLRVLLAVDVELLGAIVLRTIVVDDLSRRPLRAIDDPILDGGGDTLLPQLFDPPLPTGDREGTAPMIVSIAFSDGAVTDVRAPFPLAGDIVAAIPGLAPVDEEPISAIIACTGDVVGLARLLSSLARQQSASSLECLLIGDVPDLAGGSLPGLQPDRPLTLVRVAPADATGSSQLRGALAQATHDRILLVDDQKVLHDPRTTAVLGALSARREIGTAGCQIVSEGGKKNGAVTYRTLAGFVPLSREDRPVVATRPDAGDLNHVPLYPVLANPVSCLMSRRETLSSVMDDVAQSESDGPFSLVLGRAIVERGQLNIATSLIAVSDVSDTPAGGVAIPWLAATPMRFLALEEF